MKERTVYALGFFDGVHLAHQTLLSACRALADSLEAKAGVVTFSSHPDTLVLGATPKLINTLEDRCQLLRHYGMDTVTVLPFDRAMMALPWQDFFRMLRETMNCVGIVCGHDFRFGFQGLGNADTLAKACQEAELPCHVVPCQNLEGQIISSTYIRGLLEAGCMAKANRFLGHPHILTGEVVFGRQLGRTLGIPTANLNCPTEVVLPKFGVYACKAYVDGKDYLAVTNVGNRPTVGGHRVTIEPWLLDFEGNLYGKTLTLAFHEFLRPEEKFPNLEALQQEIKKNAAETRKILGK